jgi:hypothetical protein
MYSRRHYEHIAATLATALTDTEYQPWQAVVKAIADAFELDNPRFQRNRFLKACGALSEDFQMMPADLPPRVRVAGTVRWS